MPSTANPLQPPSNLVARNVTATTVHLTWTPAVGAQAVMILLKSNDNSNATAKIVGPYVPGTSFTINGLVPGEIRSPSFVSDEEYRNFI
jgi:hypothetical protein